MPVGCGVSLALRGTGERGHRTIPEFDPAVLQPLLTLASDGPHRVVGPPLSCHGLAVIGWANQRNRIVTSPVASDRALPLETLDECCVRSGFRIRRWLLTGNPNHSSSRLFVGTPSSNPVAGMARLQIPKGDACWRVILRGSAVSANRYPSACIKSGYASKSRNSFPDPFAGPLRLSA